MLFVQKDYMVIRRNDNLMQDIFDFTIIGVGGLDVCPAVQAWSGCSSTY